MAICERESEQRRRRGGATRQLALAKVKDATKSGTIRS
jgi:hypothetical protein